MPTLLMRLRAPMMSWGDHSRFTIRDSRREPTKSAVVGLLCAALGRPRWESVHDLSSLKMGVRVNREGLIQCDYHTVMKSIKSSGSPGDTVISHRYYMADADYLVGLEGTDRDQMEMLDRALQTPIWQLYFGRKSFVPSCPVRINVVGADLQDALQDYPYRKPPKEPVRYVMEVADSLDVRQDVPLNWEKRLFGCRCVETGFFEVNHESSNVPVQTGVE